MIKIDYKKGNEGDAMKRVVRACLALLLGILMTVNVMADMGMAQYPDYVTDYYMIVESPDGGIDFYVEASFDSAKLNTELIPNGTAFHITARRCKRQDLRRMTSSQQTICISARS